MTSRKPAVAGAFYEADPTRLRAQIEECVGAPLQQKSPFIGAVVPHAGLMYSGKVAGALYAVADLPKRYIILCPNHTGLGHLAAINRTGSWTTPLGEVRIDQELADDLLQRAPVLKEDDAAHVREHSLEVQLPLLQRLVPELTFVPICLAFPRYESCETLGNAIADAVKAAGEPVGILASSDLNHYEDQASTLRKDQLAIDQILGLDPEGLWRTVEENDISMCGYIPTTVMLAAAHRLGAKSATLVSHATSGDVNGDYRSVVGYASVLVS